MGDTGSDKRGGSFIILQGNRFSLFLATPIQGGGAFQEKPSVDSDVASLQPPTLPKVKKIKLHREFVSVFFVFFAISL